MGKREAGRWDRDKLCSGGRRCYWRRSDRFHPWCHDMWRLWALVSAGEAYRDDAKTDRVRFYIDWQAFHVAVDTGHPALRWPQFEPWEIAELLRWLASNQSQDAGAQSRALGKL